jgi:hypothetical protein
MLHRSHKYLAFFLLLSAANDDNLIGAWTTKVSPYKVRRLSRRSVISSHNLVDYQQQQQQQKKEPYMSPELLPPQRNRIANSTNRLTRLEIQKAINDIKRFVEERLENDLRLTKVWITVYFVHLMFVNGYISLTHIFSLAIPALYPPCISSWYGS